MTEDEWLDALIEAQIPVARRDDEFTVADFIARSRQMGRTMGAEKARLLLREQERAGRLTSRRVTRPGGGLVTVWCPVPSPHPHRAPANRRR